jgi:hypothetical protein
MAWSFVDGQNAFLPSHGRVVFYARNLRTFRMTSLLRRGSIQPEFYFAFPATTAYRQLSLLQAGQRPRFDSFRQLLVDLPYSDIPGPLDFQAKSSVVPHLQGNKAYPSGYHKLIRNSLREPNKTHSLTVAGIGKLFPSVLGCSIHEHSFASRCFVESDSTAVAALTA